MRALRISLIVLVVLAVLSVAADRVALVIAQNEVASRARDGFDLAEEPKVSIKGFPFLTQVLGGEVGTVTLGVSSYDARFDDATVTVHDLDLELNDIEFSGSYTEAVAARAHGTGTISYEALTDTYGELLGSRDTGVSATFEHAGGELLRVNLRASVAGLEVPVGHVDARVVLDGDVVRLEPTEESIPDALPDDQRERLDQELNVERRISNLPSGMSVDSLTPTRDGLALIVTGSDVDLTGGDA